MDGGVGEGEPANAGLEEVGDDSLAQSISYALKRDRKALKKLEPCDDEAHFRIARRIVEQLRLSRLRFFRPPTDWRGRYPGKRTE